MYDTPTIIAWLQGIMNKVCKIDNDITNLSGGLYCIATTLQGTILHSGDSIKFDTPYINFGNKITYDTNTGIFTILKDGYYSIFYDVSVTQSTGASDFSFSVSGFNIQALGGGTSFGDTPSEVMANGLMECHAGDTFGIYYISDDVIQITRLNQQASLTIHYAGQL